MKFAQIDNAFPDASTNHYIAVMCTCTTIAARGGGGGGGFVRNKWYSYM